VPESFSIAVQLHDRKYKAFNSCTANLSNVVPISRQTKTAVGNVTNVTSNVTNVTFKHPLN